MHGPHPASSGDHPRVSGEDRRLGIASPSRVGSPPRERGGPRPPPPYPVARGITPA